MGWSVGMRAAYRVGAQDLLLGAMLRHTGALSISEACGPYIYWLFPLDGWLARRDASDRDVRKKVACTKLEVSCLVGRQGSFDLDPGPEPSSLFITQVLAVGIAWAFALETGGMPVTA